MISDREYLFSLEHIGIKLGLEQIRALVARARPSRSRLSVASSSPARTARDRSRRWSSAGCAPPGTRTGRYTSPHLVDLEERFAIDGASDQPRIDSTRVARGCATRRRSCRRRRASSRRRRRWRSRCFATRGVDVAVLEVGLGGRLDATNVVDAVAVAITAIDFDHEQYLGHTIEAIAAEKAGVIKPAVAGRARGQPAGRAGGRPRGGRPRRRHARDARPRASSADCDDGRTGARGSSSSRRGARMAPITLGAARPPSGRQRDHRGAIARRARRRRGRSHVPRVRGRRGADRRRVAGAARVLPHGAATPSVIDGAHNPAGARALASYLRETYGRRLPMVVGVMRDKNMDELIEALAPAASQFVIGGRVEPARGDARRASSECRTRRPGRRVRRERVAPGRGRAPRSRSAIRSSWPDRSISPAKCAPNLWYTSVTPPRDLSPRRLMIRAVPILLLAFIALLPSRAHAQGTQSARLQELQRALERSLDPDADRRGQARREAGVQEPPLRRGPHRLRRHADLR